MGPGKQPGAVVYLPVLHIRVINRTVGEFQLNIELRTIQAVTILVLLTNGDLTSRVGFLVFIGRCGGTVRVNCVNKFYFGRILLFIFFCYCNYLAIGISQLVALWRRGFSYSVISGGIYANKDLPLRVCFNSC